MRTVPFQRGFTLLEMLMVIMLLALLIAGAYSGISASIRAMRSAEASIERVDKVRTVQEFLRHQLSRTLPFPYAQNDTEADIFQGSSNFMRFVAPMPGYLSRGGAYVQTLQLKSGSGGLQLVFTSTLLNGFDLDKSGAGGSATVVLLDHIAQGKFSYRGIDQEGNLLNWGSDWSDATATPLLVNLDLTLQGRQMTWPSMTIPIMMDSTALKKTGSIGFGAR